LGLSAEEVEEFKDAFAFVDTNSDGCKTAEELTVVLGDRTYGLVLEEGNQITKELDLDGNGTISFSEFCKSLGPGGKLAGVLESVGFRSKVKILNSAADEYGWITHCRKIQKTHGVT
jgi:hypothetical protein